MASHMLLPAKWDCVIASDVPVPGVTAEMSPACLRPLQ